MEIINKKVIVKLSKEEREHLTATIDLLNEMEEEVPMPCEDNCPFKDQCDRNSDMNCLLRDVKADLIYINNNCDD